MTDLEFFYQLKKSVLEQYQNSYPYFNGSWKSFSAQDILNLIDDIQLITKQSISEKWIYTHLKPETNQKLPRKDMLDILSVYVGKSGWDEFVFNGNIKENNNNFKLGFSNKIGIWVLFFGVLIAGFFIWKFLSKEEQKLEFQNSFTKDSIAK
jgi:hypothetical protein